MPDQRAMRLSRRYRMAMWSARAAASGSVLSGMPRCVMADPAALNVMPVSASGPVKCCRQPMPMPVDFAVCIPMPKR